MKKNKTTAEDIQNAELTGIETLSKDKADASQNASGEKSKKVMKVLNIVINVVLVVAIIFAVICTYVAFVNKSGNGVPSIFGLRLLSIKTTSMEPTICARCKKNAAVIFITKIEGDNTKTKAFA